MACPTTARVVRFLSFAVFALNVYMISARAADLIYQETFGIPLTATADLYATNFNWQRFDNNGAQILTGGTAAGVNFSANGRPTDATNTTTAGPNSDGTYAPYAHGILYFGATPSPSIGFTTEYSFDPAAFVPGSITFSWYEGNNTTPHIMRLLVRVGTNWYASVATFSTAAVGLTSFGTLAELKSLVFDPAAANWLTVNFNGDYITGATPGGTTVNSTAGALSLGAAPAAPLSGRITAFGIYGESGGGTGNRRIDTFNITATSLPRPTLSISLDRAQHLVEISWPVSAGSFVLESSRTLPATNWTQVAQAPVVSGDQWTVLEDASEASMFYRLR